MNFDLETFLIFAMPSVIIGLYIIFSSRRYDRKFLDPELREATEGELVCFRTQEFMGNGFENIDSKNRKPHSRPVFRFTENGENVNKSVFTMVEFSDDDIGKMYPLLLIAKTKKGKYSVFINNADHREQLLAHEASCREGKISKIGIGFIVIGIVGGLLFSIG